MGTLGSRFNWRSPFLIGMTAAGGVAVTVGLIVLLLQAGSVLVLIGLSLFLAVGMEPAVSSLVRHHLPRWSAVTAVLLVVLAVVTAFGVSASAALVSQGQDLVKQIPPISSRPRTTSRWSVSSTTSSGCRQSFNPCWTVRARTWPPVCWVRGQRCSV